MGRIGLLSLAAWLWLPRLLAQELPSRINIDLIGTDQELPNRNTRCIMQDQLGFLWLGAGAGLWRYDGYAFQNYTDLLTRTSGFITLINDIQKGPDGRIWKDPYSFIIKCVS